MTGEEILATKFIRSRSSGYQSDEVDALLRRLAEAVDSGRSPLPLIAESELAVGRGYDKQQVDGFLDVLAYLLVDESSQRSTSNSGCPVDPWAPIDLEAFWDPVGMDMIFDPKSLMENLPETTNRLEGISQAVSQRRDVRVAHAPTSWLNRYIDNNRQRWRDFPSLPGPHLHRERIDRHRTRIVTSSGAEMAIVNQQRANKGNPGIRTVDIRGRNFVLETADAGADPEFNLREHATGNSVLRLTGRHYDGVTNSVLHLSGLQIRFPVRGSVAHAVMTAVDGNGNQMAKFRRSRDSLRGARGGGRWPLTFEVAVNPKSSLTTELILIIAVTSGFVASWKQSEGFSHGGGV
jgi:DivIVA domain-containing protein